MFLSQLCTPQNIGLVAALASLPVALPSGLAMGRLAPLHTDNGQPAPLFCSAGVYTLELMLIVAVTANLLWPFLNSLHHV